MWWSGGGLWGALDTVRLERIQERRGEGAGARRRGVEGSVG